MWTGQVARRAGVNVQTLRYYERRGLLPEPARRDSGYRVYGGDAVRIVRFIKRAQEVGFSLGRGRVAARPRRDERESVTDTPGTSKTRGP
jgi:DNA-binding transcriptional MerR regulator